MRKRLVWLCLLLSVAAICLHPVLSRFYLSQRSAPPPGITSPQSKLLRVWLLEDCTGAYPYLKKQAAAYEKACPGTRVYLRRAVPGEAEADSGLLPDVLLFSPGAVTRPESLFIPLAGSWPVSESLLRAGRWQGVQYALPVLLGGYAWADALKGDGLCAASGVPLMLAATRPVARDGAANANQAKVYETFCAGRCRYGVLTLGQVRAFKAAQAKGKGFDCVFDAFPAGFTDLCLGGGVTTGEGLAFLDYLVRTQAQSALADHGLFSVDPTLTLYDETTPLLYRVQEVFRSDAALPSLFASQAEKARALGLNVFTQKIDPRQAFRQLQ